MTQRFLLCGFEVTVHILSHAQRFVQFVSDLWAETSFGPDSDVSNDGVGVAHRSEHTMSSIRYLPSLMYYYLVSPFRVQMMTTFFQVSLDSCRRDAIN